MLHVTDSRFLAIGEAMAHQRAEALRVIFDELGVDNARAEDAISKSEEARYETLLLATNYESEDAFLTSLAEGMHNPNQFPMGDNTRRLLASGGARWQLCPTLARAFSVLAVMAHAINHVLARSALVASHHHEAHLSSYSITMHTWARA